MCVPSNPLDATTPQQNRPQFFQFENPLPLPHPSPHHIIRLYVRKTLSHIDISPHFLKLLFYELCDVFCVLVIRQYTQMGHVTQMSQVTQMSHFTQMSQFT